MIGAAGLIITLLLHPSGGDLFVPGQWEAAAHKLIAAHCLALASLPFLFLGALGLSRRLGAADQLGAAGVVLYGFSLAAVMTAVVFDGLVTPELARHILDATEPASQIWKIVVHYNDLVDEAFMSVFMAAASFAIALWSVAMVRSREFSKPISACGLVLGGTATLALLSGLMQRHEHVFLLAIFGQALWLLAVGGALVQSETRISNAGVSK